MSSWLCYTRKMLATAISSLAEELEQTALDLNEAVNSIGMTREASLEQKLYAIYDTDLTSDDISSEKCATTQQPVKSSYLPANVVPGDLVLEDHFLTPPHLLKHGQASDSQVSRSEERNRGSPQSSSNQMTRSQSATASHVVKLGDKRPGRVVRTSSSELYTSQADWCPEIACKDLGDDSAFEEPGTPEDRLSFPNGINEADVEDGLSDAMKEGSETEGHSGSRWLGPFSRAVTLAYSQVTHAVLNLVEDVADLTEATMAHSLMVKQLPPDTEHSVQHDTHTTEVQCNTPLSLDLSPTMCPDNRPNSRLASPVSVRSTYSSDSFEVIDPNDTVMDSPSTEHCNIPNRPVFTVGESEFRIMHQPMDTELSASSAEYVQFNFSNLVTGRYFQAVSPVSHKSHDSNFPRAINDIPEYHHVVDDQSGVRMKVHDLGFESHVFRRGDSPMAKARSEDDDGSSFDVLSERSDENYIVY